MPRTENGPFYDYTFPRNYAAGREKPKDDIVTQIKSDESVSPIPVPEWYWKMRQEVADLTRAKGNRLYEIVNTSPLEKFTRERFKLGPNVGLVVGFEGSNELLERLLLALKDNTSIRTYGPYFTDRLKSTIFARRSQTLLTSEPLSMTFDEVIHKHTRLPRGKVADLDIIENPDVRGDVAELSTVKRYADVRAKKGIYTVVDRALGGFIQDSQSEATLVDENPYLIVLESFSKAFGFPDDGVSILIAHKNITDKIKDQLRHFHYRHSDYKLLYNMMSESGLLLPHLEDSRRLVRRFKPVLLEELKNLGIDVLPNDPRTSVAFVDGKVDTFSSIVDTLVTEGSGYYHTRESNPALTSTPMTNRYARIGLPLIDYSDFEKAEQEIRLVAKRISGGINVAQETRRVEKTIWIPGK